LNITKHSFVNLIFMLFSYICTTYMYSTSVSSISLKQEATISSLSYEDLKACHLRGMRNGNWFLLDRVQRGFYRACMVYTRLSRPIRNPRLVGFLGDLMEKMRSSRKIRALRTAAKEVERIMPICFNAGVFNWVPQLLRWLQEEQYLEWLGVTKLSTVNMFQT